MRIYEIEEEIQKVLDAFEQGIEEAVNETTIEGVVYGRMARDCRI